MSELKIDAHVGKQRRFLFSTVSAMALMGCVYGAALAKAADENEQPAVWIELGGQLERVAGGQQTYLATFFDPPAPLAAISASEAQRPPNYSNGLEGKFTFEPRGTNLVFSAGIRYGRSNGSREEHQQTYDTKIPFVAFGQTLYANQHSNKFATASANHAETHLVLDFQAGKDLGLGLLGHHGTSIVSLGVRFAQFTAKSSAKLGQESDPVSWRYFTFFHIWIPTQKPHSFLGTEAGSRSFQGVGPSLAWNGSLPLIGDTASGAIGIDWGFNGAVLFGRQKARTHHRTAEYYHTTSSYSTPYQHTYHHTRAKSTIVPNVGGFAGLSFRYVNAKLSLGYRADFFFGAMDGGIDARKTYDRDFYGPFATISVGLGG